MPGKRNPLVLAKSTETKVVRRVDHSRTQCYISKTYKIPQNRGQHSPFFGSILMELMPETERSMALLCIRLPALPLLEFEISLFRFPSRTRTFDGIVRAYGIVLPIGSALAILRLPTRNPAREPADSGARACAQGGAESRAREGTWDQTGRRRARCRARSRRRCGSH
jgi:hypothetical protein